MSEKKARENADTPGKGASVQLATDADGVPLKAPDEPESWLEKPATIKKLWTGAAVVLGVLVLLDLLVSHHSYFGVDGTFGFYAWYGLLTCVIMVVAAKKVVGLFLTRKDSYYDD